MEHRPEHLSWLEVLLIAQVGTMRRVSALRRARPEPYGTPRGDLWGCDVEAAAAEYVVARRLGFFWNAVVPDAPFLVADAGDAVEVRWTARSDGRLIVHDRDTDDALYILVVGVLPALTIIGGLRGADAKQERWRFRGDGRPAYFVPQTDLREPWALLSLGSRTT